MRRRASLLDFRVEDMLVGLMNRTEPRWASGDNYDVRIEDGLARIRVWRRPDLSFERGAALAEEMTGHLHALARGVEPGVRGIVFDLREAPPLMGKRTRAAMARAAEQCEASRVRLAMLAASEAQGTILRHALGREHARVRIFTDEGAAAAWASAAPS
jgi:hypothetical protein